MEVGEYETNTLVITNIASIAFRVYRPVTSPSAFAFSPTDVENTLRADGHLAFADSRRQCIWCFRLVRKDGSSIGSSPRSDLHASIDVGLHKLASVDEGAFEPGILGKGRPFATNQTNTPNSSASSSAPADPAVRTTQPQPSAATSGTSLPASQTSATSGGGAPDADIAHTFNGTQAQAQAQAQAQGGDAPETRVFPSVPVKVIYNFFISAVLAGLSSAYCSKAKAIALNNRTFLLPPLDPLWDGDESSRTDTRSLVATLRVSLTTAGALLINLSHAVLRGMGCSEWACYAGIPPSGAPVLTAPWGKFATVRGAYPPLLSVEANDCVRPLLKKNAAFPAIPPVWKSFAAKMLESRGTSTSVLQDSVWLRVEFPLYDEAPADKTVVILWPSVLCFWSLENAALAVAPFQRLDPLADLREAFLEQSRAEEAAARPKEEPREEDVAMEDIQTVSSTGKGTHSDGPSPLGVRYPFGAATGAAGAVYPTPPDGVLHAVGATPTFDGSTSSPGNAPSMMVAADLDTTTTTETTGAEEPFGEFWTATDTKRDEPEPGFIVEPDNLFGDIGVDMFGDDVTENDFDFFDDKQADTIHLPMGPASAPLDADRMDVDANNHIEDTPGGGPSNAETKSDPFSIVKTPGTLDAPDALGVASGYTPSASDAAGMSDPNAAIEIYANPPDSSSEKAPEKPVSPVFVKPELKHARSHLAVGNANGIKRPPSPFNAVTVFKRVQAIAEANKAQSSWNRASQPVADRRGKKFEGLQFTDFMIQNNKKYEQNGKFSFRWPQPELDVAHDLSSATSPTAFRRPSKKHLELSDSQPGFASLISSITRGLKASSLRPQTPHLFEDSGDTSSNSSSQASSSDDSEDDEPLAASMARRKQRARAAAETVPSPEAAKELSRAYSEGVWDFPIARFFSEPMPPRMELNFTDDDIVDVAQIITQQITRATIRSAFDEDDGQNLQMATLRQKLLQRIRYSVATLQDALPASLDEAVPCSLKAYIEAPDIPFLMQPNRLHGRLPPGSEQLQANLFPVPTPLVGIGRNDATLSILPTAIEFWEVLGLEPLHGAKDIRAVCVYPNYEGLADEVRGFLSRMHIVYESLRLGSHELLSAKANVVDGMVAFDARISSANAANAFTSSTSHTESQFSGIDQVHKLAQALAAEDTPGKSLVVYVVYCETVSTAIVDACLAFQRLSQLYDNAVMSRNSEPNDLVLQLIPSSFLASSTSLAVPAPLDLLRLSVEVYDRCTSPRGPKPAPAFLLDLPPPRSLELKLSSLPSVDVQRENSLIHVAYASSADGRWVTAAWTDGSGWRQFSSAYWLGRKDTAPDNSFSMVAQEIWTNTCAIVSNLRVHWRAVVAKCGPMEPEEMDVWLELAKNETRASISLVLATVDARPSLELLPPIATVPPTVLSQLSAATLPATSMFSPEQSGNPATPAGGFASITTPATPVGAATPATPSGGGGGGGSGPAPNSPAVTSNTGAAAGVASGANTANDMAAKLAAAGADPNTVAEIDGKVVLMDITDNTWVAVASHRLNTASTWVDLRYALVSGYLIKRGGVGSDDAPVVLEVNVVRAEGNPRTYEKLIREILTSYRSLGTLARTRGILDNERDVRPWHVAAAERSARALCMRM